MEWKVDYDELIPFLGKTIYKPENVLVELCANSYDADASRVEIFSSGESQQILIKDNGCGMDEADLDELRTIAKSKKRIMVQEGRTTPKYNRKLLGCFGIGKVSFLALGDSIKFFTLKQDGKPYFLEIKRVPDEASRKTKVDISDIYSREEFKQHLLEPKHGTTVEINNNKLDFTENYKLLRHKLSNMPLSKNFRIFLNDLEIKKDDFNKETWLNKEFDFTLDNIDPSYKSKCRIHVNTETTIDNFKRGIFLVVNGRVIEKDLYYALYQELTSPASIAARVIGHIEADYLQKVIQANREDFFDNELINEIKNKLKEPIQQIINDYIQQRYTEEEAKEHYKLLQRKENAKNKFNAPNNDLKRLGINFKSNPEFEQEVVLIIAQLCQKGLLPFQILDYNSSSHIDCIVKWPLEQKKRDPNFISELEIETTLDNFFDHNHDYRTKPDICCWKINPADLKKKIDSYKKGRPESIANIELKNAEDAAHFGHQKELHVTVKTAHNEQMTHILRVYVLSQIIEKTRADV
jgi:hypothetical protein